MTLSKLPDSENVAVELRCLDPRRRWLLAPLGIVTLLLGQCLGADWPGWRGPKRDGHAATDGVIAKSLPSQPRRIWQLKVGEGLASPVVAGCTPRNLPKTIVL